MAESMLLLPMQPPLSPSSPSAFLPATRRALLLSVLMTLVFFALAGNASAQPAGAGGGGGFGSNQGGPGGGPGNGPGGGPPPFLQNLPELNTSAVSEARTEARSAHAELSKA